MKRTFRFNQDKLYTEDEIETVSNLINSCLHDSVTLEDIYKLTGNRISLHELFHANIFKKSISVTITIHE